MEAYRILKIEGKVFMQYISCRLATKLSRIDDIWANPTGTAGLLTRDSGQFLKEQLGSCCRDSWAALAGTAEQLLHGQLGSF